MARVSDQCDQRHRRRDHRQHGGGVIDGQRVVCCVSLCGGGGVANDSATKQRSQPARPKKRHHRQHHQRRASGPRRTGLTHHLGRSTARRHVEAGQLPQQARPQVSRCIHAHQRQRRRDVGLDREDRPRSAWDDPPCTSAALLTCPRARSWFSLPQEEERQPPQRSLGLAAALTECRTDRRIERTPVDINHEQR